MFARQRFLLLVAATMTAGCYDWMPASVDYVRSHPHERIRVTDSVNQTVVADRVVVDGDDLVLVRREGVARVDFVPNPPRLERRRLDGDKTTLLVLAIVLGVAGTVAAVAAVAVAVGNSLGVGFGGGFGGGGLGI